MGKLTISMVIFNSYVNVYHGWYPILIHIPVVPLNCLRTQWLRHGVKAPPGRGQQLANPSATEGTGGDLEHQKMVAMVYGDTWLHPRKIER